MKSLPQALFALSTCMVLSVHAQVQPATGAPKPGPRLVDASVDVIVAAGGSSADESDLNLLQGGAHDPKRNGFTLQQAELSLTGSIDPYLRGEAHVLMSEDEIELEEAFLISQQPWAGWDFKAGYFLTEFGRVNASHPHSWAWVDQPIMQTRFFGGEGLRNAGVRVGRLLPTPWFSELLVGAQNAGGEFAASFLGGEIAHQHGEEEEGEHGHEDEGEEEVHGGEGIGGRAILDRETEDFSDLLYSIRWANSTELGEETSLLLGLSGLTGPNASGEDTSTWIAGADLKLQWVPAKNNRGFPFVKWETEYAYRNYEAGAFEAEHEEEEHHEESGATTLKDQGFHTQIQYGFKPGWICGIRGEMATGDGESIGGTDHDPFRSDRIRISPMLSYLPTEFTRVRLQYNYDDADHLDDTAHTVWLSLEGLWGTHPAHKF